MRHYYKMLDKLPPILRYLIDGLLRCLVFAVPSALLIYGALTVTGVYPKLESMLDLKYNSPFIRGPLYVFGVLAVLCFLLGFLLYFHKYTRARAKSDFSEPFSKILDSAQAKNKSKEKAE